MFGPESVIHHFNDSCPSKYPLQCYHDTWTCAMYDTFPNLDLTLDDDSLRSIWHLYYVAAGHKTHKLGLMTHNHNTGRMTQNKSYALSLECHCHLMPGHTTTSSISSKWLHNVSGHGTTNELFYPSYLCHRIIIVPPNPPCNPSENTENRCSNSVTVSIDVFLHHSSSQADQKPHKHYKCSALPLFLALNRSMYYLLNGTFDQASDINHLVNRLLLMLRRYMMRHNDFKSRWFKLLLSGLLRSWHISVHFIIVLYLRVHGMTMLQRYITRHNNFKHFKHRWITLLLSGLWRSQNSISLWFIMVFLLRILVVACVRTSND